jgi:hypothetical protein
MGYAMINPQFQHVQHQGMSTESYFHMLDACCRGAAPAAPAAAAAAAAAA